MVVVVVEMWLSLAFGLQIQYRSTQPRTEAAWVENQYVKPSMVAEPVAANHGSVTADQ